MWPEIPSSTPSKGPHGLDQTAEDLHRVALRHVERMIATRFSVYKKDHPPRAFSRMGGILSVISRLYPPMNRPVVRPNLVLAICCLSLLVVGMDITIVNVALPAMRR
jgi:hypothetical protein